MGLLDTTGRWGGFTGGLGGKLLTRSLSSGGFTCDARVSDVVLKLEVLMWCKVEDGSEAAARFGEANIATARWVRLTSCLLGTSHC